MAGILQNPSFSSSSSSFISLSVTLNPKPHSFPYIKPLNFRITSSSSSHNTTDEQKLKRKPKSKPKPRPSFYEQIRDKWSVKPISRTTQLPWQQQKLQESSKMAETEIEEPMSLNSESVSSSSSSSFDEVKKVIDRTQIGNSYVLGEIVEGSVGIGGIEEPVSLNLRSVSSLVGNFDSSSSSFSNSYDDDNVEGSIEIGSRKNEGYDSEGYVVDESRRKRSDYSGNVVDDVNVLGKNVEGSVGIGGIEEPMLLNLESVSSLVDNFDSSSSFSNSHGHDDYSGNVVDDNVGESIEFLVDESRRKRSNYSGNVVDDNVEESDEIGGFDEVRVYSSRKNEENSAGYVTEGSLGRLSEREVDESRRKWSNYNGDVAVDDDDDDDDVWGNNFEENVEIGRIDEVRVHSSSRKNEENSEGSVGRLPWMSERGEESRRKRSKTELAEKMIPEHELKRLRNVALRMKERMKVGDAGVTQAVVDEIHEKWKIDEVVKLKFEGPSAFSMKRSHEILESKTGGLVIYRSGSSVMLYRGLTYKLDCVNTYMKEKGVNLVDSPPVSVNHQKNMTREELVEMNEIDSLLNGLGPRFLDWSGRPPLPVDADLLPGFVPGYKTPFRLLPHRVLRTLKDSETTNLRRQARSMPAHFALGRNRELQGLAAAIVKLWEKSAIAKIAIKRGVLNTLNERMAQELKRLTGGTLLSRNKEYIVFYRGNDFMPPPVTESLKERERLTMLQFEEEEVRRYGSTLVNPKSKNSEIPLVAGTLAETLAASSRWAKQPNSEDIDKMLKDSAVARRASLVRYLQHKQFIAKRKLGKAEKALEKVQKYLKPEDLPTDLETITDEERLVFRRMGLSMKPFLLLGRREVFDGTIENMHLHWKYRELVKIVVKGKNFPQVKHIAISLEAESGGVLVSIDKSTKGYDIVFFRGKNYQRPLRVRPRNLLTRRQALARSIELQRREGLRHHMSSLQEQMELVKSELEDLENGKELDGKTFYEKLDDSSILSDDELEEDEDDEDEEAYLLTYDSQDEK